MSTDEEADGKAIPALIFAEQIDGGFGVEAQSGFAEGEKGNKTENMSPKSGTLIVGWIRTHIDVQSDIIQFSGIGHKTVSVDKYNIYNIFIIFDYLGFQLFVILFSNNCISNVYVFLN